METKNKKSSDIKSSSLESKTIPRPDISVAQIILLILSEVGHADFKRITNHPLVRSLEVVRSENSFYTALARLKRRRLITRSSDHSYELTSHGEFASLKAYVRKGFTEQERATRSAQHVARNWDGRWRMVIFDVPESQRPARDYIRGVLKRVGFYEFQRSMWIYPHKLPAFLIKMMADPKMRKYTRVLTTYDIDYDEDLRRRFKLI